MMLEILIRICTKIGGGFSVVQGINAIGTASSMATGGANTGFDVIDCHQDRLNHMLYMDGSTESPIGQVDITNDY